MGSSSRTAEEDQEERHRRRKSLASSSRRDKSKSRSRSKDKGSEDGRQSDGDGDGDRSKSPPAVDKGGRAEQQSTDDDDSDTKKGRSSTASKSLSAACRQKSPSTAPERSSSVRSSSQGAMMYRDRGDIDRTKTGSNEEEQVHSTSRLKTRSKSSSKSSSRHYHLETTGTTALNDETNSIRSKCNGGSRSRSKGRSYRSRRHHNDEDDGVCNHQDAPGSPESTGASTISSSSRRTRRSSKDAESLKVMTNKTRLLQNCQEADKYGRKESVMESLSSYINAGSTTSGQLKAGDNQSVVSSSSKRRRRPSIPNLSSSASVLSGGGQALSREELREQRRSRSSSAGHVDVERRRSEKSSSRRRSDGKKEEKSSSTQRIRRSHSDSSKDQALLIAAAANSKGGDTHTKSGKRPKSRTSSSKKSESTKSVNNRTPSSPPQRTIRSPSSSTSRRSRISSEVAANLRSKFLKGDDSTTAMRSSSSDENQTAVSEQTPSLNETTGIVLPLADRQGMRRTMTSSNGAEIPPGFPIAAVDHNLAPSAGVGDTYSDMILKKGKGGGLNGSTPVLDSTTQLRGRRASNIPGNESGNQLSFCGRGYGKPGAAKPADPKEIRDLVAQELNAMERHKKLARKRSESPRAVDASPLRGDAPTRPLPSEQSPLKLKTIQRSTSSGPILAPNRRRRQEDIDADAALPDTDSVSTPIQTKKKWWNLTPKKSMQRSRSAGPVSPRKKKCSESPTGKSPDGEKQLSDILNDLPHIDLGSKLDLNSNLLKITEKKNSVKPTSNGAKAGSIVSSSVLQAKKKVMKSIKSKFMGKKSKGRDGEEVDNSKMMETLNCSVASLDPDILVQSHAAPKPGASLGDMVIKDEQNKFPGELESKSVSVEASPHSSIYTRQVNETPDRRVSWIELPLHDPNQLLLKSSDEDGTNETCTTQEMDQISDHTENDNREDVGLSTSQMTKMSPRRQQRRSGPSLEHAFQRDSAQRQLRGSLDERTIGSAVTSNTATTNNSGSTVRTMNKRRNPDKCSNDQEPHLEDSYCGSMGLNDDDNDNEVKMQESCGSIGSRLSLTSQRRRGSKRDTNESRGKTRIPSRDHGDDDNRFIGEPTEGDRDIRAEDSDDASTPRPVRRASSILSPDVSSRRRRSYIHPRSLKVDKHESTELKSSVISSLDSFLHHVEMTRPKTRQSDGSRSVQSAYERGAGERARRAREEKKKKAAEAAAIARKERFAQFSSPINGVARRRSSSVGGLDQFGDGGGGYCEAAATANSNDKSNYYSNDADDMSVTSAPMLRRAVPSASHSQTPNGNQHRQVVDLKQTQFSNKLSKLHVAF